MLKRRPIRIKLMVAVTLLSAIVLLLAFSGFWGLYGYRQLANSVSQRAWEIQHANDIHRCALALKESHRRAREVGNRKGMIDSSSLADPLFEVEQYERGRFQYALYDFAMAFDAYRRKLRIDSKTALDMAMEFDADPPDPAPDEAESVAQTLGSSSAAGFDSSAAAMMTVADGPLAKDGSSSLENISEVFQDLCVHASPIAHVDGSELSNCLEDLTTATFQHLKMIHDGMEEFGDDVRGRYRTWITIAWTCTVLSFIIMAILLWAFRSLVVKPFRTLLDGSRLVAGGQFNHRIDLGTGDELSELAMAMNDMTDRFQCALKKLDSYCADLDRQVRDRSREVIQNEQLASVGFLAAGVAHEINNPLATIAWSAESLQSRIAEITTLEQPRRIVDDQLADALATNLRRIEEEAFRCKGITEKLLDFSRLSEVRRASIDLVDLVEDVVTMVAKVGKYRCKTLRTHSAGPVIAHVNPQEIRQVVLNLVTNAMECVDTEGAVDVHIGTDGETASVVVEDNGCGMNDEVLKHLFEPFFTRRRDGTGTGLGLSITYRIVSQHGGSLIANSAGEGQGSRMEMRLPVYAELGGKQDTKRVSTGYKHEPFQAA